MRVSLLAMLTMLTGCSMKSLITPAATVTGAAVGGIGGPLGAGLGAGAAYAGAELWTLDDKNKQLVKAITTGDVQGIIKAEMKGQQSSFENAMDTIWLALKVAAFVVLGFLTIPLFITRSNSKKINKICEETNAKTN